MWNSLPLLERNSTFIAKWKYCDWGQVVKGSIFELKNRPATWACSFWKNQYRKYRVISGLFKLFHSFFDFPENCASPSSLSVDQNALRIIHIMTEHGYLPNCSFRNSRKASEATSKIVSIHHSCVIGDYNGSGYFLSPIEMLFKVENDQISYSSEIDSD